MLLQRFAPVGILTQAGSIAETQTTSFLSSFYLSVGTVWTWMTALCCADPWIASRGDVYLFIFHFFGLILLVLFNFFNVPSGKEKYQKPFPSAELMA